MKFDLRVVVPHCSFVPAAIGMLIVFFLVFPSPLFGNADLTVPETPDLEKATQHLAAAKRQYKNGHYRQAIINANNALSIFGKLKPHTHRMTTLALIGESYIATGQYQKAIGCFQEALTLPEPEAAMDRYQTALVYDGLGKAHHLLNEFETAEAEFLKGIETAHQETEGSPALPILYNNYGRLYADNNEVKKALALFHKSAKAAESRKEPAQAYPAYLNASKLFMAKKENTISLNTPSAYATRGRPIFTPIKRNEDTRVLSVEKCAAYLKKAHAIIKNHDDSFQKGYGYIAIAQTAYQLYRHDDSGLSDRSALLEFTHDALTNAVEIAEKIDNSRLKSYAFGYLARLYEEENRYAEAHGLTTQAIFHAQKSDSPELLFRWEGQTARLMTAEGKIDQAISAYRRALFFLEAFKGDLISDCRRRLALSFRNTVGPVYFGLADLLLQKAASETDESRRQQYLLDARLSVEQLKQVELQDLFEDECIVAFQNKRAAIDEHLTNTVVIYPILLPNRIELLATFPAGLKQYRVSVDLKHVDTIIHQLRGAIEQPGALPFKQNAERMYDYIIRPMEKDLLAQEIHTLIFVPDGALRTIPMSVLYDGNAFLIQKFAVVVSPGMELTDPGPIDSADLTILLAGITEPIGNFSALPNVAKELKAIQPLYPHTLLLNNSFQLADIETQLRTRPFSVVHIASHGQFDRDPEKTFLLAYDGVLSINKLEELMALSRYRKTPVELLTLSACQTAAGDELAALGLAGVALKSGARSAIASLWFVDDQATADMVSHFYTILKNNRCTKARALQKAQIDLINTPGFEHPAYWAPFLLIGNWL